MTATSMTGIDLLVWREHMRLSQPRAAEVLGVSRRTYQSRENAIDKPIPITWALACIALYRRERPGTQPWR